MHATVVVKIAGIEEPRSWGDLLIRAVEAPVAKDQVYLAIAIEIAGSDAGPQAGHFAEPRCRWGMARAAHAEGNGKGHIPGAEAAVIVMKDLHGTPFTSQHQVGIAVPVQVREEGTGDQARLGQLIAEGSLRHQLATSVLIQSGPNRLRVPPALQAAADE